MSTDVKWSQSISTNLLKWFLLLSLTPIIIISLLVYKNSSDTLYMSVSNELEHTASSYVRFIESWFFYREGDIKTWSSNMNTLTFIDALNEGYAASQQSTKEYTQSAQYSTVTNQFQNDIVDLIRHYDYIYDIFLISTEGDILFSFAREDDLGTNLIHGKYAYTKFAKSFTASRDERKACFSDLEHYAPSNGDAYSFLTAPIIDDKGVLKGVFAIQLKLTRIFEQFKRINDEENGIHHYVLGGEDLLLRSAIDDEKKIMHQRVQTEQTTLYQAEHVYEIIEEHDEDSQSYIGPNGDEVIGKHHPIEILGKKWVLISEINKEFALASSYELAYKILFVSLIAIGIVLAAAFFLSERITRPIQLLATTSRQITQKKERSPVLIENQDEIGQLAKAFNEMIQELTLNEEVLKERSDQAAKALKELEEQKLALDAHSIVAITDANGRITYANDKFVDISGFSREELLGQDHRMINSGYHPASFWKEMYKTIHNKMIWHAEFRNKAKDGHFYWVETTIVPFLDEQGDIKSYIVIRTDITAQKEYAEKLIKAKEDAEQGARAKAEFLASMSHEIRTPMNGIIGMLGLLKNTELTLPQSHKVSLAESSALSLLTLINDILDFSKVEAGKLALEELEFNLRDELGDFAESIAIRAQEKDVELILDVKEIEQTQVIGDPGRLRQIMNNLVGNAIKFTTEGEIVVTCSLKAEDETKTRLFVTVKDSGIGIPEDKIPFLFDAFTQVDTSTTREYGGTGLGLSIVKKLIDLMGGSIHVESRLGEGSTFTFNIVLGACEQTSAVIPHVDVKGKRVLVIDDNPINREVIREQLKHWGMEVYETEDGIAALAMLEEEAKHTTPPFDVALVDMHMPHMDGAELGEKIKEIDAYAKMKLVMMTSLGSRSDAERFAEIGFDAFFPKPTTTKDLFHALNVLIDDAQSDKSSGFLTKDSLHAMNKEIGDWPDETRILLVEDNMTNQIVANGILETFGLQADVASDGQEALDTLKKAKKTKPYTMVLMDCQMPVLDGYGASEAIRRGEAGEENINIPIVAMTANAMKGDRESCLIAGMDDYLSKPINPDALLDTLVKWLITDKKA